MVAEL
jgi:hypothetical protein